MDILCNRWDVIRSAKKGRVVLAGRLPVYGRAIVVRHPRGFTTLYAHLRRIGVRSGERVKRWEPVGRCGSSGHSTAPHVHFEIRRYGRYHNPKRFLTRRRWR